MKKTIWVNSEPHSSNDRIIKHLNIFLSEENLEVKKSPQTDILIIGDFTCYKQIDLANKKIVYFSGENILNKVSVFSIIIFLFRKINLNPIPFLLAIKKLDFRIPLYPYHRSLKFIKQNREKVFLISSNAFESNFLKIPIFFIWSYRFLKTIDKNKPKKRKKFCAFMVSNPYNLDRIDFYQRLSKYKKVDSYGKLFNNCSIPSELKKPGHTFNEINQQIFQEYKFVIGFENSYAENYITEKLINIMASGAIPIYRGAPNVSDYFNTQAFIHYDDYSGYEEMINTIIELDRDDKKYEEFSQRKFLKNDFFKTLNMERKKLKKLLERWGTSDNRHHGRSTFY